MAGPKRFYAIVVIILCTLFILLFISLLMESYTLERVLNKENILKKSSLASIKDASTFSSRNDTAFVFLALGATAHQMNCPAAIESLVRFGGWSGEVYLITDNGNCFNEDVIVQNAGMKRENFHLEILNEDFGRGGFDMSNLRVGFSLNRLRSKSMKTQLFEIIKEPKINVLAYADCDIIFGVEGCANDFIMGGMPWEDRNIRFSRIGIDDQNRLTGIHTGTIVMHRNHSKDVLRMWGDALRRGVGYLDRTAYMDVYNHIQNDIDGNKNGNNFTMRKNIMMPSEITTVSTTWNNSRSSSNGNSNLGQHYHHHYEMFLNATELNMKSNNNVACMTHISKARCDLYGREAVQKFVDRFQLRTYKQGYLYCPLPILQPLLYGWFPWSYLPMCPKIEQLM